MLAQPLKNIQAFNAMIEMIAYYQLANIHS